MNADRLGNRPNHDATIDTKMSRDRNLELTGIKGVDAPIYPVCAKKLGPTQQTPHPAPKQKEGLTGALQVEPSPPPYSFDSISMATQI